jgi:hypothetical protein
LKKLARLHLTQSPDPALVVSADVVRQLGRQTGDPLISSILQDLEAKKLLTKENSSSIAASRGEEKTNSMNDSAEMMNDQPIAVTPTSPAITEPPLGQTTSDQMADEADGLRRSLHNQQADDDDQTQEVERNQRLSNHRIDLVDDSIVPTAVELRDPRVAMREDQAWSAAKRPAGTRSWLLPGDQQRLAASDSWNSQHLQQLSLPAAVAGQQQQRGSDYPYIVSRPQSSTGQQPFWYQQQQQQLLLPRHRKASRLILFREIWRWPRSEPMSRENKVRGREAIGDEILTHLCKMLSQILHQERLGGGG